MEIIVYVLGFVYILLIEFLGGIRSCVEKKVLCTPKGYDENEKMFLF